VWWVTEQSFVVNLVPFAVVKTFANRSRTDKVMAIIRVEPFFDSRRKWYPMRDVRTHNSTTDNRRMLKFGGAVYYVSRYV